VCAEYHRYRVTDVGAAELNRRTEVIRLAVAQTVHATHFKEVEAAEAARTAHVASLDAQIAALKAELNEARGVAAPAAVADEHAPVKAVEDEDDFIGLWADAAASAAPADKKAHH